jgi:hypothetical protein
LACLAPLAVAGCGGGQRQDENEPSGTFRVEVVKAQFPAQQKLAKRSNLVVTVRNAGSKTIPNVAVTVHGFNVRKKNRQLADPERPVFLINGRPREIGGFPESQEAAPLGCDTAYVDTWACGKLKPGAQRTFGWSVTAVQAGRFKIAYVVAAGLNGKAKAVDGSDGRPNGAFAGTISSAAPKTRVADDGRTVVSGTR